MKKLLGRIMLGVTGWKYVPNNFDPKKDKKTVLICVPHTSNWDFFYALACFWIMEVPIRMFIKDYYTKGVFGFFFRSLGCIGVDRSKRQNLVEYATNIINTTDSIAIINTPEGTRGYSDAWKQGFYHIAKNTNVPIVLAYADYKKKACGIIKLVHVEDKSFEQLLDEIAPYYNAEMAKFPENYNPKLY